VRALRSSAEIERSLKRDAASLFGRALTSITKADIRSVLEPKGATHIANRLHGYLRTFYKWALDHDLVAATPVPSARPLKTENGRERVLSDDELAQVWRATETRPVAKRGIVQLLILTGSSSSTSMIVPCPVKSFSAASSALYARDQLATATGSLATSTFTDCSCPRPVCPSPSSRPTAPI
jgi:site-specific recombinase XerD